VAPIDATNVIAEGEVLQLMNAHNPETTQERYLVVFFRKTARLFQAGGEVAAVVSGADEHAQRALAIHDGIWTAYQLGAALSNGFTSACNNLSADFACRVGHPAHCAGGSRG
jgi:hypothetical protein